MSMLEYGFNWTLLCRNCTLLSFFVLIFLVCSVLNSTFSTSKFTMRNNFSSFYCILIFLLSMSHGVKAQSVLDQQITVDYTGYLITDAFEEIEKNYPVHFFYRKDWIEDAVVQKMPPNKSLKNFIEWSLDDYDLSYIDIQEDNIILVPQGFTIVKSDEDLSIVRSIGNPMEKGKYSLNTVEGYVYFGKTGDPIIGAVVIDKKSNRQTISDYNGHYEIKMPGGKGELEFSFMGVETSIIALDVFSHGTLDCELMEASIAIDAINVTAHGGRDNLERTQMGVVHVDMKSLNKLPVLMGEADIIKGMTLLPGVQTPGELSSGFNVRGGNVDQNQVLVDGVPFYSTAHLFGMFSTLIPDAVSNVDLHKGTQPASYGSRLSSVMNVKLKNSDTEKISGKAGIGILNSSLFVEGPIKKDVLTFLVGGRITYSDWVMKLIPDINIQNSETQFYDLIGKVAYNINKKNKLELYAYNSKDYFNYGNKNSFTYGSLNGGVNYRLFISNKLSMHLNFGYSNYESDYAYFEDIYQSYTINTGIKQYLGKAQFFLNLSKNAISFGLESSFYSVNPGVKTKYDDLSSAENETIDVENAIEYALFVQDDFKLSDKISLMAGLRYSWYSKVGSAKSYIYDPLMPISESGIVDSVTYSNGEVVNPYDGFEPRLSIKYGINGWSSIKAGYHMSRQYQHLISNSSTPTPSDYWKSVDQHIKPMLSQQYSLGYFRNFNSNTYETSAELYYKEVDNLLEYRNGAILSMNKSIEQDVLPGVSHAYGLELMVKKNNGKLKGWASYTLSRSMIKVDGNFPEDKINDGNYFPTYNDRLHDLSISLNYQLTKRWNFAGNFILISGRPTTFPEQKYEYRYSSVVYFSERNKYRLPAYHRFDVSLTYDGFLKKSKKVHPSFTFSVYNLYGHNNVYSAYYKQDVPSSLNNYERFGLYKLSIIGAPIPSLTVNLSF